MPDRIQLRRAAGWRMPENTIKVDRTTPFGNCFVTGKHGTRLECVGLFALCLDRKIVITRNVPEGDQLAVAQAVRAHALDLRGKNLGCWCDLPKPGHPDICHARIIMDYVNCVPIGESDTMAILRLMMAAKKRPDIYMDADAPEKGRLTIAGFNA